jgi:DNA-binding MarR family transcriptional regulator
MGEPSQLSVNDRVLLHLSRFATDIPLEAHPAEATQAGIAAAVNISRTHVPRAVKNLIRDGAVEELRARVEGHERRMSVYALTAEGLRRTEQVWKVVLESRFSVLSGGKTVLMTGKDMEALVGKKRASAAIARMKDGVVAVEERRRTPVLELAGAPEVGMFYGRDAELKTIDEFMDSESKVMVILANKGYGATALARRFIQEQDETDLLWVALRPGIRGDELRTKVLAFAGKVAGRAVTLQEALDLPNALIVFDDFFSTSEDAVEFFTTMMESGGSTKVLVTAREEMPAYEWIYHKKHVDSGVVRVLKLRGLDEQSARKLLGNDLIEPETFKRILRMTRGQPLALRLLREGDFSGLKDNSVFTSEEARYLLLLKDKSP